MTTKQALSVTSLLAGLLAAALLFSAFYGATAEAARGAGRVRTTPAISVSPNPAPAGITEVTVSGSGFKAGEGLNVGIPGVVPSYPVVTDSSGAFSLTYTKGSGTPFSAGEYTFQALHWRKNSWMLAAKTVLVVQ